jgi:hypothetical protein
MNPGDYVYNHVTGEFGYYINAAFTEKGYTRYFLILLKSDNYRYLDEPHISEIFKICAPDWKIIVDKHVSLEKQGFVKKVYKSFNWNKIILHTKKRPNLSKKVRYTC